MSTKRLIKSKERIRNRGEVFTAEKELNVAIYAFRLYESASLDYTGIKLSTVRIGV